jgi:rod shape-determining protein MreB
MITGLPKTIVLASAEVRAAMEEPVSQIVAAVKDTLDRTPPELAGDIMDRGITLAGGGALLQGMDQRLREECQMPAQLTESPLTCVAVGSGRSLEEFEVIHRMNRTNSNRRRMVSTG